VLRQIRKTTKNHPGNVSSSNAAARNPEERVQLNKLEHFTTDYLQRLFKQIVAEKRKASEDED